MNGHVSGADAPRTLAELIDAYRGDRSFAKLAAATDGEISIPRFHTYGTGELQLAPSPEKIKAIARALGVREATVWTAVGVSLGLDVATPARGSDLDTTGLPPAMVKAVARMLSEARAMLGGGADTTGGDLG